MNLPQVLTFLTQPLAKVGESTVTLGSVLAAIGIALGIWWLASAIERLLQRRAAHHKGEPWKHSRLMMMSRVTRYMVWIVGTLFMLRFVGIDLTSIALLGSALAVGLGFGLQNIVANFVSGLIILLERSLRIGDFIELSSGVRGHVREIAMRYTRITTNEQLDVLVPNAEFITGQVINWTHDHAISRMHVPFSVAYGSDKARVREAGLAAARAVPGTIEDAARSPGVWLVRYGEHAIEYELAVWVDQTLTMAPKKAHARLMWALDDALAAHGIALRGPVAGV